jgi:hypothetical protein
MGHCTLTRQLMGSGLGNSQINSLLSAVSSSALSSSLRTARTASGVRTPRAGIKPCSLGRRPATQAENFGAGVRRARIEARGLNSCRGIQFDEKPLGLRLHRLDCRCLNRPDTSARAGTAQGNRQHLPFEMSRTLRSLISRGSSLRSAQPRI